MLKMNLDTDHKPFTHINSKNISILNINTAAQKSWKNSVGEILDDFGYGVMTF
jgi:hypothetical protein